MVTGLHQPSWMCLVPETRAPRPCKGESGEKCLHIPCQGTSTEIKCCRSVRFLLGSASAPPRGTKEQAMSQRADLASRTVQAGKVEAGEWQ